jgi:hypothetical protein
MLVGTFLGVFVVPALYVVFQRISEWWQPIVPDGGVGELALAHAAHGAAVAVATPAGDGATGSVPEPTETPIREQR